MQGGEGAGAEADDSQHPLGKSSTFCMKCNLISTVVVGETGQVKETESRRLGLRETAWESIALGWVGQGKARQGGRWSLLGLVLPRPVESPEVPGPTVPQAKPQPCCHPPAPHQQ